MTKEEALHFLRNVGPTIYPAQLARKEPQDLHGSHHHDSGRRKPQ